MDRDVRCGDWYPGDALCCGSVQLCCREEPILKTAAYILVLNIGVELLLEDLAHIEIGDWTRFGISLATIALSLAYAHIPALRIFRPLLIWLSQGFALVNGFIGWVLAPFVGIFNLIAQIFKRRPATTG